MARRFNLQGRKVLLTGATRGIGGALAAQLVARGAVVLAVARDRAALAALSKAQGARILPLAAELATPEGQGAVIDWVTRTHPDCSVLINNAAIMVHGDLTRPAPEHLAKAAEEIAVNLTAPIALAVALLPVLGAQGSAAICNVTSGIAIAPTAAAPVYAATKAGLRHFTLALRYQVEEAGLGLLVSECIMTLVDTTLSRGAPGGKYPPERAAADLLAGLEAGRNEIWVEKTKLLRVLFRLSPALARRIMRGRVNL